ncbi:MAG: hypothetical protein COZ06_26945 [Armatimonadetes bacterium CG_4_10_14_3_um_filter_66_18]|nr:MAG: hypothetical protein COZ06_26945 [Armatimonadetes bacterium CG_4_10_14_3_um_filter_66_18]
MSDATALRAPTTRGRSPAPWRGVDLAEAMDEHDLYPVHEEDDVPEKPFHERLARYLRGALATHLPNKWVTGNVCMYWEERNFHRYLAPDVLVVDCEPPADPPDVHLKWADPPALLVIEVGSKSTFLKDEGPKLDSYGLDLRVPEYLYYHPTRRDLRFWRLANGGYLAVMPDARGWMHSETIDVWFGADEHGWLHVYAPSGERLLSHEEEARGRREAEGRAADMERQLTELQAELARLKAASTAG